MGRCSRLSAIDEDAATVLFDLDHGGVVEGAQRLGGEGLADGTCAPAAVTEQQHYAIREACGQCWIVQGRDHGAAGERELAKQGQHAELVVWVEVIRRLVKQE